MYMIVMPIVGLLYLFGVIGLIGFFPERLEALSKGQQILVFFGMVAGFPLTGFIAAWVLAWLEWRQDRDRGLRVMH